MSTSSIFLLEYSRCAVPDKRASSKKLVPGIPWFLCACQALLTVLHFWLHRSRASLASIWEQQLGSSPLKLDPLILVCLSGAVNCASFYAQLLPCCSCVLVFLFLHKDSHSKCQLGFTSRRFAFTLNFFCVLCRILAYGFSLKVLILAIVSLLLHKDSHSKCTPCHSRARPLSL